MRQVHIGAAMSEYQQDEKNAIESGLLKVNYDDKPELEALKRRRQNMEDKIKSQMNDEVHE